MMQELATAVIAFALSPYGTHIAVEEDKRLFAGLGILTSLLGGVALATLFGAPGSIGAFVACVLSGVAIYTA